MNKTISHQGVGTLVAIDALTPYAKNSRRHSDAQIEHIASLIEKFGFVGAIVIREGVIAKGHGTLAAVKHIERNGKMIYPAPGRAQGAAPFPSGFIPVLDVSGWTDAQFRAYVIADNQSGLESEWDNGVLSEELAALLEDGFDIDITGFDAAFLDADFVGDETQSVLDASAASAGDEGGSGGGDTGAPREKTLYPVIIYLDKAGYAAWRAHLKASNAKDGAAALAALLGKEKQ